MRIPTCNSAWMTQTQRRLKNLKHLPLIKKTLLPVPVWVLLLNQRPSGRTFYHHQNKPSKRQSNAQLIYWRWQTSRQKPVIALAILLLMDKGASLSSLKLKLTRSGILSIDLSRAQVQIQNVFLRMNVAQLTRGEKDILLLGMICAHINTSSTTVRQKKKKGTNVERKQTRMRDFMYEQRRLCRFGFFYLFDTSLGTFTTLKKHYLEHGLIPRTLKAGNS